MTLPSVPSKSTIDFSRFDAMSVNIEEMLQLPAPQPQPIEERMILQPTHEHPTVAQQQASLFMDRQHQHQQTHSPVNIQSSVTNAIAIPQPEVLSRNNVATASASVFSSQELAVENVMTGIYLTTNFIPWNEENLRTHGFTHIIIIDKHIQELYYPSPIFKLVKTNTDPYESGEPFEYYCPTDTSAAATNNNNNCNGEGIARSSLSFGKEFEAIDLNFGEKSYLTKVLPNCYRAVKFINKALESDGTILVIDCNGGEQKCLTIVVAYLMYKYNLSFRNAFDTLKNYYEKADLDRFYMSQLYEYEPILQVQRLQSRGSSCSREMHAAILKRKNNDDDFTPLNLDIKSTIASGGIDQQFTADYSDNGILHTLNPLRRFNVNVQEQQQQQQQLRYTQEQKMYIPKEEHQPAASALGIYEDTEQSGNSICDDYNME